jgi:predicted O-methyltransferase YrrM
LLFINGLALSEIVGFLNSSNIYLKNLSKGGDIIIKIDNFDDQIIIQDLDQILIKLKFKAYIFIYAQYRSIMHVFSNPIYLYISDSNTNTSNDISNIGPTIQDIQIYTIKNLTRIYKDLTQLNNSSNFNSKNNLSLTDQLHKYILNNLMEFYYKYLDLRINKMYVNKYNYSSWKKHLNEFSNSKVEILELGVFEGSSSVFFLDNFMNNPDSKLYLVDTWAGSVEYKKTDWDNIYSRFKLNILNAPNSEKVLIFRKNTFEMLLEFLKQGKQFDIIFIDANHDGRAVMMDTMLAWRVLKLNGFIIFDDYIWEKTEYDYERPKMAIDAFLNLYQANIKILYKKSQVMIKKTSLYDQE